MRWIGLALVLLLGGCTAPTQVGAAPAGPASSSRIVSTPRQASFPEVFDLPLSKVGFSCRLPISTPDQRGAFISFPAGSVSYDANGKGGRFYDRAYSRWLPVERGAVSPGGSRYAYSESGWMHIVDITSGQDRRFQASGAYVVIDYAVEGVYLARMSDGLSGLWLMDPASGEVSKVADLRGFQVHGTEREFWVGSSNPAELDRVDRLDLSDGYRETWLYRRGTSMSVLGLDAADHPIVRIVSGSSAEIELLLAPDKNLSLFVAPAYMVNELGSPVADSNGIWFGSSRGIYLFTPRAGFNKVSNQPGVPAGFCL
jgi:hypothetical protein